MFILCLNRHVFCTRIFSNNIQLKFALCSTMKTADGHGFEKKD